MQVKAETQARLRAMLSVDEIMQILRSLMCVFFCGGSCIEDVSTHLMIPLSSHPRIRTCSSDTILRTIKELTVDNTIYISPASGKLYDFNTVDKMNELLIKSLLATGGLRSGQEYDLDFDHQFIQTEKYDAKRTYKKFTGYSPGIAVIGNNIVGIENRDGNTNVRFCQQHTLERIFDDMNNGFGWKRLPKSFMAENTVYLLMTALVRNFYKTIIQKINYRHFILKAFHSLFHLLTSHKHMLNFQYIIQSFHLKALQKSQNCRIL